MPSRVGFWIISGKNSLPFVLLPLLLACMAPTPSDGQGLKQMEKDLISIVEKVRPFAVMVQTIPRPEDRSKSTPERISYSGTILDEEGTIVTSVEVVTSDGWIYVVLHDGRVFRARALGVDEKLHLGLIRIDGYQATEPPPLGDSETLVAGSFVAALGAPFGLQGTVTTGILSGRSHQASEDAGSAPEGELLQIQAPVNPGDVGGALVNSSAEITGILSSAHSPGPGTDAVDQLQRELDHLIGVVHLLETRQREAHERAKDRKKKALPVLDEKERDWIWSWFNERLKKLKTTSALAGRGKKEGQKVGSEGIHFAVPMARVLDAVDRILEKEKPRLSVHPDWGNWIGITIEDVPKGVSRHLNLTELRGLSIQSVVANGPAARAGVRVYDILWTFGDEPVYGLDAFSREIDGVFRSEIPITVIRKGAPLDLKLEFGPEAPRASIDQRKKGAPGKNGRKKD